MGRWIRSRALLAAVLAGSLAGCAVNPVTGERELRLISESEEIAIGEEQYGPTQQAMGGPYNTDPELVAYVEEVGQRVAAESHRPDLPYEFVVLNDGTPNAWALPGGKIAVNRGLLTEMDNEAELAAVLGHEITHSAARHGAQRVERGMAMQVGIVALGVAARGHELQGLMVAGAGLGAQLISQRYSREAELEADHYGTRYMAKAGYDPQAAVSLQETFVELAGAGQRGWLEGLFASHPPSEERVRANRELAAELAEEHDPAEWTLGEAAYAERMAPLREHAEAYAAHESGQQALADGDPERALELAERALEAYPEEAAFHALKGTALARLDDPDAAEAALTAAIERNDAYFAYHLERGMLRQETGQRAAARTDLERANDLLPTAPAHLGLGRIAEADGERARAVEHYELAAESDSRYGERARRALSRLGAG